MNQQSETLKTASEIELAITCGFIGSAAQYQNLLLSAVSQLRALHARVEELEKDRGNAKRLVSKIWNQHPEARDTIEKATGAWLVFGQDVETGGVSAQRVTQGKDHIAQPTQMATTTVVLPEPIGTVGAAPGTSGFTLTVFEAARVPVGTNIYTEQQVRELLDKATCTKSQTAAQEPFGYFKAEPFGWRDCAETDEGAIALYEAPQPQEDARDAQRYRWLRAQPLESDNSMFCTTIWRKGTDGFGDDLRLEKLDAAIDAAISEAKEMK